MHKPRLCLKARLDGSSGYGQHAIQLARDFIGLGYHVSILPYLVKDYYSPIPQDIKQLVVHQPQAEDWELILAPLDIQPTEGKRTAFVGMWESSRIPAPTVEWLNRCEVVIVPCRYNADCFSACGVTAPIAVCPLGVDPKLFKPSHRKRTRLRTIGVAGGLWDTLQDRKGLDLAIQAFCEAFHDQPEVSLEIKTFPGQPSWMPECSRISFLARHLASHELVAWYQSLDLFLCTSSGGGWEMMLHQAMACGVPCVTPKHGGMADYFTELCGVELEFEHVPAGGPYDGTWAQPSFDHLVATLKTLKASEATLAAMGLAARQRACEFTWERSHRTLERILIQHGALPPKKPKLVKLTDEEKILRFYRNVQKVPRLPVPAGLENFTLTNLPQGLGDTVVLTDLPRKAHRHGQQVMVHSTSPFFDNLMRFNPYWISKHGAEFIMASQLLDKYDCGNGHTIQRIQRAWGYEPDLKPKGCLETSIQKIPNRIVLHLEPGYHSLWQRENLHPRARQIYPETRQQLQAFIRANQERFEFVEVGKAASGLAGVENKTALALEATIELLASCEYFIGIISGIYHLAAALDVKTILVLNFPHPRRIYQPTLVDFGQVESEWTAPQSCILHQEGDGEMVSRFTAHNLELALAGEIHPFWSDRFLPLIHEKL